MKKKLRPQYRQGDVLLIEIGEIPQGLVKTKKVTLALGEATGHHHTITAGATGYATEETALAEYVEVAEALAALEHQEHSPITLPKGRKCEVIHQFEYSPAEIRRVAD